MFKRIYILLTVMIGCFLAPSFTYACDRSAAGQKACCQEASESDPYRKPCCEKENTSKHKCGDDGKCKDKSCHCPTVKTNVLFAAFKPMQYHPLVCIAKQAFADIESHTLSGFFSVWLPPKIS